MWVKQSEDFQAEKFAVKMFMFGVVKGFFSSVVHVWKVTHRRFRGNTTVTLTFSRACDLLICKLCAHFIPWREREKIQY